MIAIDSQHDVTVTNEPIHKSLMRRIAQPASDIQNPLLWSPPNQRPDIYPLNRIPGLSKKGSKNRIEHELELELIQTHMAQKPLLWVEVGAHAVRNRAKCGGVGWAGAGVAWRLGVCVVFGASPAVWRRQLSLCGFIFKKPGANLVMTWSSTSTSALVPPCAVGGYLAQAPFLPLTSRAAILKQF